MPRAPMLLAVALAATLPPSSRASSDPAPVEPFALDVRSFRPVEGPSSGPAVYYQVDETPDGPVLHGTYAAGAQTVTMGIDVPEPLRRNASIVRWSWRARIVPERGDECVAGLGDSAASVSLAFKRGLRWYILKYVWSGASPLGATCDRKRNPLLARDTVVLERGPATDAWVREEIDVRRAFVDHFADGDPHADVPDLVGIGVMTDGDQTSSPSGADWTGFEVLSSERPAPARLAARPRREE